MNKQSTERIEKVASIILLLLFVGAFPIMPPQEISLDPLGGPLVNRLVNVTHYLVLSIFMIRHWKGVIYTSTRNIPLLLLIGLIHISALWSVNPDQTLFNAKGILRIYLLAAYLSWHYSIKEQMWMLSWALGITALLSMIVALFVPGYGVSLTGEWCGVYGHKNGLGYSMALSAGVFLHLALSNYRYWWILWTGFALSVSLILLSNSTTGLAILLVMIVLLFFYRLLQKNQYKIQVIFINVAILFIVGGTRWFLNNAESLVATQGKDLSLTGRTPMWSELIGYIAQKPLLGYGFFGFWTSVESLNMRVEYPWASNAHNGFIDLFLSLGLLGFILFAISFLQFFLKSLRRIVFQAKTWEDFWPMQVLVFIVIINFSESRLIIPTIHWLLYTLILLSLVLESQRIRKRNFRIAMESKIDNSVKT